MLGNQQCLNAIRCWIRKKALLTTLWFMDNRHSNMSSDIIASLFWSKREAEFKSYMIYTCHLDQTPHFDMHISKTKQFTCWKPTGRTWIFHEIRSWLSRGHNIPTQWTIPHTHKWNLSTRICQNTNERRDICLRPSAWWSFCGLLVLKTTLIVIMSLKPPPTVIAT